MTESFDLHRQFDAQGYVILKDFLEPGVVRQARTAIAPLVDREAEKLIAAGKINDPLKDEPFETRLARLYEACSDEAPHIFRRELHLAGLFDVFFHPRLLDVVETLLGREIRLYPNYSVRPKLPDHAPTLVLWHQDGGYTQSWHLDEKHAHAHVDALRMVNVWMPLVPAREENGCMQFIPGTHTIGLAPHERREYYLEISKEALEPLLDRAVSIEADPGDIVLFHNMLFHQGLPNRSKTVRWSMDWRYQDATQPTLRKEHGHLARSRQHPEQAVKSADEWARLTFG